MTKQFGFRKARSTFDAILLVKNNAQEAIEGKGAKSNYCAVIFLDVKNAFNSARWHKIKGVLKGIDVPAYLYKVKDSYLSNRKLLYKTEIGEHDYQITMGVPQGSVMGPLLWKIMYNGVLNLSTPEGTTIVGFADDIAIEVAARQVVDVQLKANEAIAQVKHCLCENGLILAEQKTEAVFISKKRTREQAEFIVGD